MTWYNMLYLIPFFFVLVSCSASRPKESSYFAAQHSEPSQSKKISKPEPSSESYSSQDHDRRGARIVFIDAGHGGHDKGTSSKNKMLIEKNLTLETARKVERLLLAQGYRIFMSRRSDVFVPLPDRVDMASKRHANAFVSIHYNYAKNTAIQGSEVFYFTNSKQPMRTKLSRQLGSAILNRITKGLPTPSRGVKSGNFCVIRETTMPAVLVEVAFLSNPNDVRLILDLSYRNKIAQAIAGGVEDYFYNKKEKKASPARIERAACRLGGDRSIH